MILIVQDLCHCNIMYYYMLLGSRKDKEKLFIGPELDESSFAFKEASFRFPF